MKPLPPAMRGLPLVGNVLDFARDRNQFLRKGYEQLGPIYAFKLATQPVVLLVGPEYHKFFFTETDKTLDMEKPYDQLAATLGKVAFLAGKEIYQNQHPILYAPFHPKKMAQYVEVMQREVQRWIDALPDEGVIDISAEMGTLVQTVAGTALMGDEFQRRHGKEFWQYYDILGKSLSLVVPPHWPLPRNIRRERAKAAMRQMLIPIIQERRQHPEAYDDFLQDFVSTQCRDGAPADDETISALLRALMFASHETTAGQSAWTIIELLRHPDYRRLVEAEIDANLPIGQPVDGRALRALEHVYWAVREVERLHPSADTLLRAVEEEAELGGYRIPEGWFLMVAANISHRLPELFTSPNRFDPLRFAPDRAEDKQHGYTLIGFGGGKHKCAGMNFANNEMMVITALLFQQLDMVLLTKEPQLTYGKGASRPEATAVRYRRRATPLGIAPTPAEAFVQG
ncbi:MAG: cytochrome P450 [Anaerolineales bacterium]|nr:cytochrome P450 [Anaerolineales bacterium]MCB9126903.1 cytochrome P450 [Ardenticatenales bacterium]MCB9171447.1 cytochrome P450 [Ardenticatenales bacterium]